MKHTIKFLIPALLLGLTLLATSSALAHEDQGVEVLDCNQCHECKAPTAADPCLKTVENCPRHSSRTDYDTIGPDKVVLDLLEDLYVPVYFNHRIHAEMTAMSGGCEQCHHYSPPNQPHPACKECHPVDVVHENLTQPGLKGAYHRNCLGCHREWNFEYACEICHAKKADGDLEGTASTYRMESYRESVVFKDVIVFTTDYEDGDHVPFHHRRHVDTYGMDCADCHKEQSCSQCHVDGVASHPMGALPDIDLHETCYICHADGDDKCSHCHGRSTGDIFRHSSTGWVLKGYHSILSCDRCHENAHQGIRSGPSRECRTCHKDGWDQESFCHELTGVELDEVHREAECGDCHQNGVGSPSSCDECHDDERVYSKAQGFIESE
jgi:hypothetical protein